MAFTPTYLSGRPCGFYREGRHLLFLPRVGARYIVPSSQDHHTYLPPIAPLGKIGRCRAGFLKPAFLTLLPLFPCRGHLLRWPSSMLTAPPHSPPKLLALPHEYHSPARYKTAATYGNLGLVHSHKRR